MYNKENATTIKCKTKVENGKIVEVESDNR